MGQKKVVLVTYPDSFTLEEAKGLVDSADRQAVKVFTQKYLNHSQYGVGSGKAEEIKQAVEESGAEQVVVDERLNSRQLHNLEKLTGVPAIDRERLILDIFYSRATTTEAKLQIELAEIKYQIPRVRENAKLMSSSGERPGKGGMGEYVVDVKFRDLKRRMSFVRDKLDESRKKRELYHQQRVKTGMPVISLVGYTSSGKTTLFNLLTREDRQTSAGLFTTLSTTTRALRLGGTEKEKERGVVGGEGALLTDTVGFISRLPTYMIDAFKSTLEESLAADLVLLLVDASEGLLEIKIKYAACWQVLDELKVDRSRVAVVFTKYDLLNSEDLACQLARDLGIQPERLAVVSSKSGYGVRKLKAMMMASVMAGAASAGQK